jgi:hypothetical protein
LLFSRDSSKDGSRLALQYGITLAGELSSATSSFAEEAIDGLLELVLLELPVSFTVEVVFDITV